MKHGIASDRKTNIQTKFSKPGILLLDKPEGPSSNHALQKVKRLFNAKKAGHTGSLDPLATGMLPICFNAATKFCQYLLGENKTYEVVGKLGETTTTADAEGEIIDVQSIADITRQGIEAILANFRGEIMQIPPMYSALKHQGKPLYALARKGIHIEREARPTRIDLLELLEWSSPYLTLRVKCSKGTYVRSLIHDMGQQLGCGGHVSCLRRTEVGHLHESLMVKMSDLEDIQHDPRALEEMLLPVEQVLASFWPSVTLTSQQAFYFLRGQTITVGQLPKDELFLVFNVQKQFIGLGAQRESMRLSPVNIVA